MYLTVQDAGFVPSKDGIEDAFASNRPLPKPVPLVETYWDDELARIERIEIVMKDMRNDFKSLTLRIEERDAAMKGHVDSLTNDIKAKDAEIVTTQSKLKESESKVAAQEATIQALVVALLQAGHGAKKQREVTLAKQADLEGRIGARDKELEMTRAKLDDANNMLAQRDEEFHDSLDDAQTTIEEGIDWSDDLDALVDDKNRVIEDMKVKSRNEIDLLKAHILELEGQVIASFRDSRPVTLQATTLIPLDIVDGSSTDNSPVSPMSNLPQDADYFERLAPELAYENPKAEVDVGPNPELFQTVHINRHRIRKGEPHRIKFPYATKRWQVRKGQTLSVYDLETGVMTGLCRSQPPVSSAPAPAPSPQLRAGAPSFVPGFGQTAVQPSELRPNAPAFTPRAPTVETPPLDPVFNPRQPPFRVPQRHTSAGEFTPTHYMQPVVHTSTPLYPAPGYPPFFPGPFDGSPTTPITPPWINDSPMPLPFGPYTPRYMYPPFLRPVPPFQPCSPLTNDHVVNSVPPIEEVTYPSLSTNEEVSAGTPGIPSPIEESTTESSIASMPSVERVARDYEVVTTGPSKSFPNLRARKDPFVVEVVKSMSTRKSCKFF
ncbi:hypothetical protein NLI96_g2115 [Meripilus lineatus]|uniref:Uncharacterized protein n=1 Tax=Meripilus lineatus TaxID=2056292 RepID=A0AAD5VBK9_9APHY|nr:hypothetical protein NLI96_g2115 [Physisporinus lineatus]